jgi:EAL domain-containing protein (putative c-di-GMP-specific phosphodiesterase class I)/DNA-binding NarL/FixJ family response regulator
MPPSSEDRLPGCAPHTVVVIDDHSRLRQAISAIIDADPQLTVIGTADCAMAGVELIRALHPDAAICDVKMPDASGSIVASEARRIAPGTRVIALSAYEDGDSVVEMLRAGAVSYITKSSQREELLGCIHKALRGQSTIPLDSTSAVAAELRRLAGTEPPDQRPMLRKVLANGLMRVVLQPIVDLSSGRPIAFEALARFDLEPRRAPDRWFEEAGRHGLGLLYELTAVRLALEHLSHLPRDCALHINVSPAVAAAPQTRELLSEFDCRRIVLEITEHDRLDHYGALCGALALLRGRGIRVAVDDVGAGFASMRHVISLEPEVLKLDISLIRDIHDQPMRRAMVRTLAEFGRSIGALVVGEGVEVQAEASILTGLGVPAAQGFLFGRPEPCQRCLASPMAAMAEMV